MLHRVPIRLDGLGGNHRFATATDGGGNHDRQNLFILLKDFLNRHERGFRVERIKNRFDEQNVRTTRDQSANLVRVSRFHLIKRANTKARVIRIRRVGKRNRQRPDRARDEAWTAGLVRDAVGPFAALLGGLFVDLPREVIEEFILDDTLVKRRVFATAALARVVHEKFALADARRRKSVRLDDVRARFEKAPMDVADRAGLRERIKVAVVLEILFRILEPLAANLGLAQSVGADSRAHRAVKDDDAFAERALKKFKIWHSVTQNNCGYLNEKPALMQIINQRIWIR